MSTVAEEQVLVVPTSEFHALGHFQGFTSEVSSYLPALLDNGHLSYQPRGKMEQDPSFKQLIPYVLFRYLGADGKPRLFQYTRGGGQGEARLHAKRSVGIGGHISTADAGAGTRHEVYREGMLRELDEEVVIETPYTEQCVGLINDDETPVGQVHLGIVHLFDVDNLNVHAREEDILGACFVPIEEILPELDDFETWSQIVVKALFG
ncbi:MAG: phosphoesterase [Planctomycetales bacterium]|nr:phosphoesterase [Planctomycetales bacterium]